MHEVPGSTAAAQEPSAVPTFDTPKNLSAMKQNHSRTQPYLRLGGGHSFRKLDTSLRSRQIVPPHLGSQLWSPGTHETLPGAAGVDTKSGAAIQRPVAPGEAS